MIKYPGQLAGVFYFRPVPLHQKKIYSLDEAREKIRRYCAYQERSQFQVEQKLKAYGLIAAVAGELLIELIQDNFLNEQRFADAFVRGKHNQKGWGKRKIEAELFKHRVSKPCLAEAMANIEDDEYLEKLKSIARKKWDSLEGTRKPQRVQKVIRYLQGRGYFYDEIKTALNKLDL